MPTKSRCYSLDESIRQDFQRLFYDEQNIYLNGLLQRHETKKTSGHPRTANPTTTSNGKDWVDHLWNKVNLALNIRLEMKVALTLMYAKEHSASYTDLDPSD